MKKRKLKIIFTIIGCLLTLALVIFAIFAVNNKSSEKTLDRGLELTKPGYIMLSAEKQNITIVESGEYILTGENKNNTSVIVEAKNVTLILEDAIINNGKNAGIINLSGDELLIVASDNTTNQIIGGNPAFYNAPIYSNGNVTIGGENGVLIVGNQQSESPMILTENDQEVTLTNSTLIGLDISKWAEKYESSQKTYTFDLNKTIKRNDSLTFSDVDNNNIFNFSTKTKFKKLLINSSKISPGTYDLYLNNEKIASEVLE